MNIKLQRKELTSTKNALKNEWMRKQLNIEIKTVEEAVTSIMLKSVR